ncbi:MAG: HAMP domain-containing histidine kinase [Myxococcales bacterium]|nr:HAMP domain-containing histidine kinase [Myxococcales bacterium]
MVGKLLRAGLPMVALKRRARRKAVTLALVYGVLAGAYIVASSLLLGEIPIGHRDHAWLETLKGIGFVAVTAVALGVVLHRDYSAILEARAKLAASATALAKAHNAASLSVVTGAIAHDMRNLLAAAITNLDFVGPSAGADAETEEVFRDIRESLDRLSAVTGELLGRGGRNTSTYPPADVDLAKVVEDCVRLTSLFARGHRCEFETSIDGACIVRARRQELECAVLNLLLNAIDANQHIGKIALSVARREEGVVLSVRDEGPGVPQDLRLKIFEPFFTTKGEQGNGVGLSVTRALMRSYGGDVRLSDPGPGAQFEIKLPAA